MCVSVYEYLCLSAYRCVYVCAFLCMWHVGLAVCLAVLMSVGQCVCLCGWVSDSGQERYLSSFLPVGTGQVREMSPSTVPRL